MIKIRQPYSFSEIGRKENQEDYLYPPEADKNTRVFILCDGMGGHARGEEASMTAATVLGEYLSALNRVDVEDFETGLAKSYDALDEIDAGEEKKPGTTLTCLCLNDDTYLVAHIGDSRIYHIRPSLFDPKINGSGIIYQSSDHSLVNELLKAGEITEEEARDFPRKNIITRAMQPRLEKRYKADIYTFSDLKSGDYFFLCSDGVMEKLSNEKLCAILADHRKNNKEKIEAIKAVCSSQTRDNYSCWLIPVDYFGDHSGDSGLNNNKADVVVNSIEEIPDRTAKNEKKRKTSYRLLIWLIVLGILAILLWLLLAEPDVSIIKN